MLLQWSFAKLVTKILANRLAPLMSSLVSNNQIAFVGGLYIHDNFILVQQLARVLHTSKEPHSLLKLDIPKAFDSFLAFSFGGSATLGFWSSLVQPYMPHSYHS